MVEKAEAPDLIVGKREVPKSILVDKGKEEWRPGTEGGGSERGGPGGRVGLGPSPEEAGGPGGPEGVGPALTDSQLAANRKLVESLYIGLVAGARVLLKLPDTFVALPEEKEALANVWATLIPPDYELPKALIVTAAILGQKMAQAVALKKEAKKAPPTGAEPPGAGAPSA